MFFGLMSNRIIEYELDNGIRISSGRWKNFNEAKREYKRFGIALPKTRELFNIPSVGKVYCQMVDIDDGFLLLEAKSMTKLCILFDSVAFSDIFDIGFSKFPRLIRLKKRPPRTISYEGLFGLTDYNDRLHNIELFRNDIRYPGEIVSDKEIIESKEFIIKIALNSSLRKTLKCFHASQKIYSINLVPSYVDCHGSREIQDMPSKEFNYLNLILEEDMALSYIAAYRGIEAIFNNSFGRRALKDKKKIAETKKCINQAIPTITWKTLYPCKFYCIRNKRSKQVSRVLTMLKIFLIFRDKAGIGHGQYYQYNNKFLKLKMDLFFEIKNFLLFLIDKKLESLI